ncbi:MAG: hypothetical protein LUD03_05615 [Firmicutes bacterium]|nr:hypothetical protein [Bacillota bacterium]
MNKIWKRIATAALAAATLVTSVGLTSCSSIAPIDDLKNPEITIMLPSFNTSSADESSPVVQAMVDYLRDVMDLESLTIHFKWAANTNYSEKVTAAMGSSNWPHIMLITDRTSTIIQNSRAGSFWDLTDELKATTTDENGELVYKYPNLAQTDDMVNHNISIDGRVYGVYRPRTVGRAGVTVRADWIDNLYEKGDLSFDSSHIDNLTMAEFEEMLYAFKEDDPDNNGEDDTYGMIVAGGDYLAGPLDNLAVWNGAPNAWGYNEETDQIEPDYMFEEYVETLTMMRQWKADGVINKDMDTFSSDNWNQPFLLGQAGVIIDVADRARRVAASIEELIPEARVDLFGYVTKDENTEPRTYPTTGYSGYFVLPTASVENEEQRDLLLSLLDHCNDTYITDLLNYGIEGESYETITDDDGSTTTVVYPEGTHYARITNPDGTESAVKSTETARTSEYADLNQFAMGFVDTGLTTYYTVEVAKKTDQVYDDNELYKVPNVAEAYVSATYSRHSTQLDAIMNAATVKYISGAIDLDDWYAERDRWLEQGGQKVIEEMNESYREDTDPVTDESIKEDNHRLQYERGVYTWLTDAEIAQFSQEDATKPETEEE